MIEKDFWKNGTTKRTRSILKGWQEYLDHLSSTRPKAEGRAPVDDFVFYGPIEPAGFIRRYTMTSLPILLESKEE